MKLLLHWPFLLAKRSCFVGLGQPEKTAQANKSTCTVLIDILDIKELRGAAGVAEPL
ncbi:hypothetical protein [Phaeobacter piscinae]|uniref:hypothetical protein n=1 Tax=Phaeobacter piscinae TaxID=1580596 RepID=UPI001C302D6E|nr:hypothetical protein [Phaeobacter piscinae]